MANGLYRAQLQTIGWDENGSSCTAEIVMGHERHSADVRFRGLIRTCLPDVLSQYPPHEVTSRRILQATFASAGSSADGRACAAWSVAACAGKAKVKIDYAAFNCFISSAVSRPHCWHSNTATCRTLLGAPTI
jgi:hypothetical protein